MNKEKASVESSNVVTENMSKVVGVAQGVMGDLKKVYVDCQTEGERVVHTQLDRTRSVFRTMVQTNVDLWESAGKGLDGWFKHLDDTLCPGQKAPKA